jgi:uncharacterized protein YbjQ (UPF0145 family)
MFTSTLSATEFALLDELRIQPLAQVLGASVQQIAWQYLPPEARWATNELFCELDELGRAWDQARRRAIDRMREEAMAVGADAVAGVSLRRGEHDLGRRTVEFVVSGTAVRRHPAGCLPAEPGPAPVRAPGEGPRPALSALSGQELWRLHQLGWEPAELVASTAVFFVAQGISTRWRRRLRFARNQEIEEFSHAFTEARRAAVLHLRGQAASAGASGIVGVKLEHHLERRSFKVGWAPGQAAARRAALARSQGGPISRPVDLSMPASGGADAREGVVITIQALGTAIRPGSRAASGRSGSSPAHEAPAPAPGSAVRTTLAL